MPAGDAGEARRMVQRREVTHGRLRDLYQVSEALLQFEGDATTLAVQAVVAQALPVRRVLVLLAADDGLRLVALDPTTRGTSAEAHARAALGYLARATSRLEGEAAKGRFVLLPLTVERRAFGALQVEPEVDLSEDDLLFLSAVANQLAAAIARHAGVQERQRALEEGKTLAEAFRARLERLVDGLPGAFLWEMEPHGARVTYVSARTERLLGDPRERWLSSPDPWAERVHPDDLPAFRALVEQVATTGQDGRLEHRCLTAAGATLWLHTGVHHTRAEDGGPRLQGLSLDVSAAKATEHAARRELAFNQAVTRSLGEGVLTTDLQRQVTYLNPAARRLLGVAPGAGIGERLHHLLTFQRPDGTDAPYETWPTERVLVSGAQVRGDDELIIAPPGGPPFPVSYTCAPLLLEDRLIGAALVFQDVLALKRAVRVREEILGAVSHDLRGSLHTLLAGARLVGAEVGEPHARRHADLVVRIGESMQRIIADLLDVAALESGRLSLELREHQVGALLQEALDRVAAPAAERGQRLALELPGGDLTVRCDRERTLQVMANLLNNALKFTPSGGSITLRAEPHEAEACISVRDTGPGIAPEDLGRVFARFWQARPTAHLGKGLGLSIVRGIVESQGGHAWAESTPGAGSTFSFTVPRRS